MPTWLMLIVLLLAAFRITRLVVRDDFPPLLWMRDRLAGGWRPLTGPEQIVHRKTAGIDREAPIRIDKYKSVPRWAWDTQEINGVLNRYVFRASWSPHWLAELVTCPWCASAYVSGALVALTWVFAGLPVPLLMWPAVWAGSALLASREWA